MPKKICIIIPVYNEEKRISPTLEAYGLFFSNRKKNKDIQDFEILCVVNNTTDKSEEIIRIYQKKFKEIKILNFKQGGKGFAITEGFKDALKRENDLIGFVDADMATPPEAFYDLVKNIKHCDGLIASRSIKGARADFTLKRKLTHKGFNFVVRGLFLFNYRDTQCGAKLFKRNIFENIIPELKLTEWAFDVNLLYLCKKNKFKIKEVPTIWIDKKDSTIASVPKTSLQMFLGILRLRLINSPFEPILRPVKFILVFGDKIINKK